MTFRSLAVCYMRKARTVSVFIFVRHFIIHLKQIMNLSSGLLQICCFVLWKVFMDLLQLIVPRQSFSACTVYALAWHARCILARFLGIAYTRA